MYPASPPLKPENAPRVAVPAVLRGLAALIAAAALSASLTACRASSAPTPSQTAQTGPAAAPANPTSVREPAVAGANGFYPDRPEVLKQVLQEALKVPRPAVPGRIVGIMVPHAGYQFSAPVAAYAYRAVEGLRPSTVVLLGPSHSVPFTGAALDDHDAWQTPLGQVPVNTALREALQKADPAFGMSHAAHAGEHSLEVQVPFLQTVISPLRILPILVCDDRPEAVDRIADTLSRVLAHENVLLVASTDLSHYPSDADARRVDQEFLRAVGTFDPAQVRATSDRLLGEGVPNLKCCACGLGGLLVTMKVAKALGADQAEVLHYANSRDATDTVLGPGIVGYGAVAFTDTDGVAPAEPPGTGSEPKGVSMSSPAEPGALTEEQQRVLLRVARQALTARVQGKPLPDTDVITDPVLREKRAAFVTLKKRGQLRGCIGHVEPMRPLVEAVAELAVAAGFDDYRFPAVRADELADLEIDISAMSPLRKVTPEEIVVGKHGVVVEQNGRRGVFLPQVAPEQGWDRDTMLTVLCREKAGLPGDAWKKGADLWVFTAQVFSEKELGIRP